MLKRTLAFAMALVLLLSLTVVPVSAEEESGVPYDSFERILIKSLKPYLRHLTSSFTKQSSVDNRMRTLINLLIYNQISAKHGDEFSIELSAEEYMAELEKLCVINDRLLEILRSGNEYNAEKNTYTVSFVGFAGALGTPRVYRGYEKVGDCYKVYFRYTNATMEIPDYDKVMEYYEQMGRPYVFTFEGQEYADNGDDILYAITEDKNNGICFTVKLVNQRVYLVSADYFCDVDVTVPDNNLVNVTDSGAFAKGTKLTVEELTKGTDYKAAAKAMRKISGNYDVYEFTATLDGAAVQPDGTVTVTFAFPEDFWHEDKGCDVTLYYLAPDGTLEEVETYLSQWEDSLIAKLTHFSTYILVDNLVEPPANLPGDVSGDDKLDYNDALMVLRASINLATLTPEQEALADFNNDGIINYNDALAILRDSIGL